MNVKKIVSDFAHFLEQVWIPTVGKATSYFKLRTVKIQDRPDLRSADSSAMVRKAGNADEKQRPFRLGSFRSYACRPSCYELSFLIAYV